MLFFLPPAQAGSSFFSSWVLASLAAHQHTFQHQIHLLVLSWLMCGSTTSKMHQSRLQRRARVPGYTRSAAAVTGQVRPGGGAGPEEQEGFLSTAFPHLPAGKARPAALRGRAGRWQCRAGFRSKPAGTALRSLQRALLTHSAEEKLGLGRGST
ncbi:hypothetical protein Nmel_013616, partial [Mimus melanotis]